MTEEQIEDSEIMVSYLTKEVKKLLHYELNGFDQEQKEFILMKMNEQFRFKL